MSDMSKNGDRKPGKRQSKRGADYKTRWARLVRRYGRMPVSAGKVAELRAGFASCPERLTVMEAEALVLHAQALAGNTRACEYLYGKQLDDTQGGAPRPPAIVLTATAEGVALFEAAVAQAEEGGDGSRLCRA